MKQAFAAMLLLALIFAGCTKTPSGSPSGTGTTTGGSGNYYCYCTWTQAIGHDTVTKFTYAAGSSITSDETDCETTKTQWAQGVSVGAGGVCTFQQ
jgi:hypothetical protein